jgi:hypothetical protein
MFTSIFNNVHKMHLTRSYIVQYFEGYIIQKGFKGKDRFFGHLVDYLYSLDLEFLAISVGHMFKK